MTDVKQREKCLKEVKLLQSLDHPNIIRYLDSFIENNDLYIAVEWAQKGDLKYIVKRAIQEDSHLEESKVWEYIYQMAGALSHMHTKRIMHRDLKPANIFIDSEGALKLGDLGLGRAMSSQTLEAYSRVGTPLYMSPEVLDGSGYDTKSDVWSLGCIAYELWALKSPFRKEDTKMSLYDLFQSIKAGVYPAIPDRYSYKLRLLIDSIIKTNPIERLDIDQIVKICEMHQASESKKPKVDAHLIMDDIIDKLKLLDYERKFVGIMHSKSSKMRSISRIFFSHYEDEKGYNKWEYLYELCYWLMSLSQTKRIGIYLPFSNNKAPEEAIRRLIGDCKKFGVKFSSYFEEQELVQGYGESVCYLVDDLLNRELIRRDYKFYEPVIPEDSDVDDDDIEEAKVEDNDLNFGSSTSTKKTIMRSPSIVENAKVTKTNFFNNNDSGIWPQGDKETASLNDSMIVCNIDQVAWDKEIERVQNQLVLFSKDQNKIELDPLENFLNNTQKVELNMITNRWTYLSMKLAKKERIWIPN